MRAGSPHLPQKPGVCRLLQSLFLQTQAPCSPSPTAVLGASVPSAPEDSGSGGEVHTHNPCVDLAQLVWRNCS